MVYMIVLTSRVFGEQCLCVGEKCSKQLFTHLCFVVLLLCVYLLYIFITGSVILKGQVPRKLSVAVGTCTTSGDCV